MKLITCPKCGADVLLRPNDHDHTLLALCTECSWATSGHLEGSEFVMEGEED